MVEGRLRDCDRIIKEFHLDMLYLLGTKINPDSLLTPTVLNRLTLFPNEGSCDNFSSSAGGCIWLKWNTATVSFTPQIITSQILMGK